VLDKPITIYGDGKQIRDVLHVKDLCWAYAAAIANREAAAGQAFNIGGGPQNTLSLRELLDFLQRFLGKQSPLSWDQWRPGDQPVFVCDLSKAKETLGWQPQIGVEEGVRDLAAWVAANPELFAWLK
jgi:CDP-paratose 2-epimerase